LYPLFIIFDNDLCSRLAVFVYAHEIVFFLGVSPN